MLKSDEVAVFCQTYHCFLPRLACTEKLDYLKIHQNYPNVMQIQPTMDKYLGSRLRLQLSVHDGDKLLKEQEVEMMKLVVVKVLESRENIASSNTGSRTR